MSDQDQELIGIVFVFMVFGEILLVVGVGYWILRKFMKFIGLK